MTYHYVWLIWSSAFLLPWGARYLANVRLRPVMRRTSLATALVGLTEPIFVPRYWNPPSLFELAQRTGFDLESLIFCFAIGGIDAALYATLARQHVVAVSAESKMGALHRFHLAALLLPAITALLVGAIASVVCRPGFWTKTLIGGAPFLILYAEFMLGLVVFAPGYIGSVWNLPALSGAVVIGIPLAELLFGLAFGLYWTRVYEHVTWSESVAHARARGRSEKLLMTSSVTTSRTALRSGLQREDSSPW